MNTSEIKMTKSQEREIERLIVDFFRYTSLLSPEKYEIKKLDIMETTYKTVIVVIETGMKGDEGTAASILCRSMRQFFIGPRGKVHWYEKGKPTTGKYQSARFHNLRDY